MLSTMPRRTNKPGPSAPRSDEVLHVRIDPAIDAALDAYLDATEPRVSKTAAVESALREFLRAKGYWPPKSS